MGYSTDFMGEVYCDPPLNEQQVAYLTAFASTRRVSRDAAIAESFDDPIREAVGLPIGYQGGFYVGASTDGQSGQGNDASITQHNDPPGGKRYGYFDVTGKEYGFLDDKPLGVEYKSSPNRATMAEGAQPGLWCQWVPSENGTAIQWDEREKFYDYIEWMVYIIHHFLEPWGVGVSGEIRWVGEDSTDQGAIVVDMNKVRVAKLVVSESEYQQVYAPA